MKKILYLDCFSGAAGDMFLGMLADLGIDLNQIETELKNLPLPEFSITAKKVQKQGIASTGISIQVSEKDDTHRHLSDILNLLENSDFSQHSIAKISNIFHNLARAEAKIHGTTPEKVHFHEVGGLDSIIDIFGTVLGLEKLSVDSIYSSPIHLGQGRVHCEHGVIPVPSPATLELIAARKAPVYSTGTQAELCTPTGASIITTLAEEFGPPPAMQIQSIGYGAGSSDLEHPNLLRGILGFSASINPKSTEVSSLQENYDQVYALKANLDDMNPEFFSELMASAFQEGALDVTFTPIQMKKQRPGSQVEILSPPEKLSTLQDLLLRHSTTLGVRSTLWNRIKLEKQNLELKTSLGPALVKLGVKDGKVYNWSPEYETARKLAKENNIPLKEVYNIISYAYMKSMNTRKEIEKR